MSRHLINNGICGRCEQDIRTEATLKNALAAMENALGLQDDLYAQRILLRSKVAEIRKFLLASQAALH